jgi:methyl coenzyme M reductase gamma subunit
MVDVRVKNWFHPSMANFVKMSIHVAEPAKEGLKGVTEHGHQQLVFTAGALIYQCVDTKTQQELRDWATHVSEGEPIDGIPADVAETLLEFLKSPAARRKSKQP